MTWRMELEDRTFKKLLQIWSRISRKHEPNRREKEDAKKKVTFGTEKWI